MVTRLGTKITRYLFRATHAFSGLDQDPIAPPEATDYVRTCRYLPANVRVAVRGREEIMKTRDIAMLCAAIVLGTAPITAPAAVAAATLRTPVILAQAAGIN